MINTLTMDTHNISKIKKLINWRRNEHLFFVASLILKGFGATLEIIGGLAAFFVSAKMLGSFVNAFVRRELIVDPNDFVANYLLQAVHQYVPSVQFFIGVYLLTHGIVKLFLIYYLLKQKLWAYPTAIVVFSLFVAYQAYKYIQSPNINLIFLTALDMIIIVLTYYEYKFISKKRNEEITI